MPCWQESRDKLRRLFKRGRLLAMRARASLGLHGGRLPGAQEMALLSGVRALGPRAHPRRCALCHRRRPAHRGPSPPRAQARRQLPRRRRRRLSAAEGPITEEAIRSSVATAMAILGGRMVHDPALALSRGLRLQSDSSTKSPGNYARADIIPFRMLCHPQIWRSANN